VLGDLLIKICTDPVPVPSSLAAVPPAFDAWVMRALERDPQRRFGSALEMAQELRSLAPPSATPLPSAPRAVSYSASAPTAPIVPRAPSAVRPANLAPVGVTPPVMPERSSGWLWIIAAILVPLIGLVLAGIFFVLYLNKPDLGWSGVASPSASAPAPIASGRSEIVPPPSSAATTPVPKTATPIKPSTPSTSSATGSGGTSASSGSDACQRACAKIAGCGEKCNFGGPCVGVAKSVADCINSKKTCLDMAGCGG
jgi:serine/threonine-protein kinase